ncbi:MAG: hypothetical protein V1734_04605 [Nanoarchaeota archaeon]
MYKLEEMVDLAKELKAFAVSELGISENPSFQSVEDGEWFYGIYTSRTDRIEPYFKGYPSCEDHKDKIKWEERIAELSKYDINIYPIKVEAQGFKECQIKKSLIRNSKSRLAYVVLHENVHIHCDINNIQVGRQVEESLADCFAYEGARLYFSKTNPAMARQMTKLQNYYFGFFDIINKFYPMLAEAYKRSKEEGRVLLETAEKKLEPFRGKNPKRRLNNAHFLCYSKYSTKSRQVFEALKGIQPKEYMANKDLLYEKLKHLLPPKAE